MHRFVENYGSGWSRFRFPTPKLDASRSCWPAHGNFGVPAPDHLRDAIRKECCKALNLPESYLFPDPVEVSLAKVAMCLFRAELEPEILRRCENRRDRYTKVLGVMWASPEFDRLRNECLRKAKYVTEGVRQKEPVPFESP